MTNRLLELLGLDLEGVEAIEAPTLRYIAAGKQGRCYHTSIGAWMRNPQLRLIAGEMIAPPYGFHGRVDGTHIYSTQEYIFDHCWLEDDLGVIEPNLVAAYGSYDDKRRGIDISEYIDRATAKDFMSRFEIRGRRKLLAERFPTFTGTSAMAIAELPLDDAMRSKAIQTDQRARNKANPRLLDGFVSHC